MLNNYRRIIDNDNLIMEDLVQWVIIEHEKKDIAELLREMGYFKIIIYGYGYLGKLLENVLKDGGIHIECIMDRKFETNDGYKKSPNGDIIIADAIIVTSPIYYKEIREGLRSKGYTCDIRLIDEILFQL